MLAREGIRICANGCCCHLSVCAGVREDKHQALGHWFAISVVSVSIWCMYADGVCILQSCHFALLAESCHLHACNHKEEMHSSVTQPTKVSGRLEVNDTNSVIGC